MAISKSLLLKKVSGRIEDLIVYERNGQTCLRRAPEKGTVKLTPGMKEQQERWAGVAAFYQAVKAAGLERSWRRAAEGTRLSGYNLFVRRHQMAFTKEGRAGDLGRLAVTVGSVGLPDGLRVSAREGRTVTVEWQAGERYPDGVEDDRLVVVLAEQGEGWRVEVAETGVWKRKEGRAVVRLPPEWADAEGMFCFFQRESGEVSESVYLSIHFLNF